jgi:hypothetical protein
MDGPALQLVRSHHSVDAEIRCRSRGGSLSWTSDALTALALHGYLRDDFSRNADKTRVTWRDAVRLRLVSMASGGRRRDLSRGVLL